MDSVIPFTGKCHDKVSLRVTITLQWYVLIVLGLKPNGISKDVRGERFMFFLFYRSKSKTLLSSSVAHSNLTETYIDCLNGFLNLTLPEKSLPRAPTITVVSKS